MKKTLCLYFQVHQPLRLRQYRFFDIGIKHDYYDEFANRSILRKVAERCYLPMNLLLMELIREYGQAFKISFSLSGMAIEQFEKYAPEVLLSFRALADTGCVEFLSETYPHSLASLKDPAEFEAQVAMHKEAIERHFGQTPVAFRNTELIYSDAIGEKVADMGYSTLLIEGARHVLGWKSPNFVYTNPNRPKLKLLLKNYRLSDDIAFRFSNREWDQWPLTAEKYALWLNEEVSQSDLVNLFMDYETFGEHQCAETGIFAFFRHLPEQIFAHSSFEFLTPTEAAQKHLPVAPLHVPFPISWADEERDTSAWLGNELQNEAVNQLYTLSGKINDENLLHEFRCLQASDHFYYMCTKFFSDGAVHKYFNPYATPYEAFINYMNILSDFMIRVDNHVEKRIEKNDTIQKKVVTLQKNFNKKNLEKTPKTIVMKKTTPVAVGTEPKPAEPKAAPKKAATTKKAAAPKKAIAKKAAPKVAAAPKKAVAKKAAPKAAAAPKKAVAKKAAPKAAAAPKKAVAKKAAPKVAAAPKKAAVKKAAPKAAAVAPKKAAVKKAAPKAAAVAPKKAAVKKAAPKAAAAPKKAVAKKAAVKKAAPKK